MRSGEGGYEKQSEDDFCGCGACFRFGDVCCAAGGGAGRDDCAGGEFGGGWCAGDSGGAGGDGRAIWIVSQRDFGGLASDATRDVDCDAVRGYAATAFGGDADGRAASVNVLCGFGW